MTAGMQPGEGGGWRWRRAAAAGLERLWRGAADIVVPPVCLACQRSIASHDALCPGCWCQISFIRAPLCDRLGIPLPFDPGGTAISAAAAARPPLYNRARAVAAYDGVLRDLVHAFKYADRHDARRLLANWMMQAGAELIGDADLILPVPLNRYRLLARRFNQAALLAHEIGRRTGRPVLPQALIRTKRTLPQVGLTQEERRRNVAAAFAIGRGAAGQVQGSRILLIDDVITTGATVEACTRVLLRAGAAQVDVLAVALVTSPGAVAT